MRVRTRTLLVSAGIVCLGAVVVSQAADADDPDTKCVLSFTSDYGTPFYDPVTGEWIGRSQEEAVAQARAEHPKLQAARSRARDTESFEARPGVSEALVRLYERARPTQQVDDADGATQLPAEERPGRNDLAEWKYTEDGEVRGSLVLRDLTAGFEEDVPSYWVVEAKDVLVPAGTCGTP